jgi:hypothetical protein
MKALGENSRHDGVAIKFQSKFYVQSPERTNLTQIQPNSHTRTVKQTCARRGRILDEKNRISGAEQQQLPPCARANKTSLSLLGMLGKKIAFFFVG